MRTLTDLVTPFMSALGKGFSSSSAPDGTAVVSTPFRFFNGDAIELAIWEDDRGLYLSDRGGLTQSLLLKGLEVIYDGPDRQRLLRLLESQGVCLRGASVVGATSQPTLGSDVQRLLQTLVDAQVAVRESQAPTPVTEPEVYRTVRQALEEGGARYRENMRITGSLGRRYSVHFQLAFRTEDINRAIMVVATGNTLEMAERWNFRFRDIRRARPRLQRLFLVADDAPWSMDAQRTIKETAEAVFAPGEEEALRDYLRMGHPAA
ncbi:MAG: DUF1828 domain-containing protein [Armatimonadota bacterium]|jgi:hypothetical protein